MFNVISHHIDVNECLGSGLDSNLSLGLVGSGSGSLHNMCSQHCNNTEGSHFCDCYVGYELQDDGLTCTGEQMVHI